MQPTHYKHKDKAHKFDFAVQHCLLFKLHADSIEAWVHFIAEHRFFLNKLQMDWMDRVLLFGAAEPFPRALTPNC